MLTASPAHARGAGRAPQAATPAFRAPARGTQEKQAIALHAPIGETEH